MPENQSTGIEQVVSAVTAATGTQQRQRGTKGQFTKAEKTVSSPAEGPIQGPDREIGKQTLARKEAREAFDLVRGRYSEQKKAEREEKPPAKVTPQAADTEPEELEDGADEGDEHSEAKPKEKQRTKRHTELDIAEAEAALIRHGFKKKEIDAMPISERVARGQSRMKADAAAMRAAEKQQAQSSKGTSHEGEPETQERSAFNVDALKPLAKTLGLEESEAKSLADAFGDVVKPLVKEIETLKKQLGSQAQQSQESLVEDARRQLRERFPELDESDQFEEVLETMTALGNLPKYKRGGTIALRVQQLMRDAAVNVGLRERDESEEEEHSDAEKAARKERRAHGRVTTDSRGTQKPATKEQSDRAAFNTVRSGGDVLAARRAAGRD